MGPPDRTGCTHTFAEKMEEECVRCSVCEVVILPSTAEKTGGTCMPCARETQEMGSTTVEDVLEKVTIGIRFLMAIAFCVVAAILGYGMGATIWSGVGVVLALCLMPVGFIYGFFAAEINFCIRMAFKAFRLWAGF